MLSTEMPLPTTGSTLLKTPASPSPNQNLLPLTAVINKNGELEIGGCSVPALVEQFGSPLYILDETTLRQAAQQYRQSFQAHYPGSSQVIYASKAWSCLAVVAIAAQEGLGFDVVSGGELFTTVSALKQLGWDEAEIAEKIYFHGNNKSVQELQEAIAINCTIIVDNWLELETLTKLAADSGAPVKIMLRLTPGIECHTHEYIKTGHLDSKFGFDPNQLEAVFTYIAQQPSLHCLGLHAHIGSQIFERQPHKDLGEVLVQWFTKGLTYGLPLTELNIGGGLGICYTESDDPPSIEEWAQVAAISVAKACDRQNIPYPKLIAEPGRSLVGSACVTAYRVGGRKVVPNIRTYISVDGGMSDNPRPITYQSVYRVALANRMNDEITETVTVAGKHCESGDILVKDVALPAAEPGDIMVVAATGAYNHSMASNYNRLGRPAAVLVNQGQANLILQRETYTDLLRQDCLPNRLLS
ncbi:diaminopimelate decarboxylase [Synechocystis sp. PCC 6803]|uniref:Diaminopimelate decarboxylase n=1 Tax=Synechocystis sp. (strain ATCC 27184 / PCC 6803 / Kazusa) TaxID=1111708 RepID=DCDA_SYNY3|nr:MULTISPECIES: diaminopimelate decarboxylase [unclassified Synechocystis]Q55484.1 RecName: Full=Diaminopimelate decarboxylase; Short=DAP decarboxylase; Short=DAPDC [Synechocystis sp. PCC 6803 substr. Kazusa]BAM53571.1 diaminopimelate decarboxylase [Synechocystis sp. PCC 6803] [Bacillus subtilis BEST7613]AGF53122.1 diaminopimelate decarboxylase [Synechocystis sp. PCC 6803]ALJ69001.1 diaminopimelate decarboxylase [Synechocystis sp. PCC 6803]AVP90865.1 diaminopimelate decarboxylase [Synechocyst